MDNLKLQLEKKNTQIRKYQDVIKEAKHNNDIERQVKLKHVTSKNRNTLMKLSNLN